MKRPTKRNGSAATNDRPACKTTKNQHSAPVGATVPSQMAVAMRQAIQQACAAALQGPQIQRKRLHLVARVCGRALTEVLSADGELVWYVKGRHDHRAVRVGAVTEAAAMLSSLAAEAPRKAARARR